MLRRMRFWALVLASAVVCSAIAGVTAGSAGAASKPVKGGAITMLMVVDTNTFDAAKISTAQRSGSQGQLVYDHLIYLDKDLNVVPGLALSFKPDSTFTKWTIKLRPGVKFTDGTALDAAAVQAHFARCKDPATACTAAQPAAEIASMAIIEPLTLEVTLSAPDATWIQAFGANNQAGALNLIPSPTAVAKYGANFGKTPETTVGAGPFMLKEWVINDHEVFERNPNYWDQPKPYLDTFTIKAISDEQTRYNTFSTGGADMLLSIAPQITLKDLETKFPFANMPLAGNIVVAMRMDQGPTSDILLRKTLFQSLDRQSAMTRATNGNLQALESWFSPDAPFYDGSKLPKYDVAAATKDFKAYLAESGQTSADLTIYGSDAFTAVVTALKQDWDKIPGLNVTLGLEPSAAQVARTNARNYQGMFMSSFGVTPRQLTPFLLSTSTGNIGFINNPAIDAAITKANATTNQATQKEQMKIITDQLGKTFAIIPIYQTPRTLNWQTYVKGLSLGSTIFADNTFASQDLWRSK